MVSNIYQISNILEDPKYVAKVYVMALSVLIKLVAYLSSKFTEQLYILQNTPFSEKVRFPEVTHYFLFLGKQKEIIKYAQKEEVLNNNVF